MHNFLFIIFSAFCSLSSVAGQSATIFEFNDGQVAFTSDAPLELIEAQSIALRGLIDTEKRTFAFSILISSFEGFNNPLQQEHFKENYMESSQFSTATFLGKIIEPVDLSQDGDYIVRAKGKLTIHGVEQERIIKSSVKVLDGVIDIRSSFTVLLHEHDIDIPRIVFQKIAEEIKVELSGRMKVRGL